MIVQGPNSTNPISCQAGRIDVDELFVPIPANHVDVDDCPSKRDGSTNFCGKPLPPATYQISVTAGGSGNGGNSVSFTVAAPKPNPVSISLLYPNYLVSAGDMLTLRAPSSISTGNLRQISSPKLHNLL